MCIIQLIELLENPKSCQRYNVGMKCPNVNATKVEKRLTDGARLNPKRFTTGNQQPSPEQGKVQRLSEIGVAPSGAKWWAS